MAIEPKSNIFWIVAGMERTRAYVRPRNRRKRSRWRCAFSKHENGTDKGFGANFKRPRNRSNVLGRARQLGRDRVARRAVRAVGDSRRLGLARRRGARMEIGAGA